MKQDMYELKYKGAHPIVLLAKGFHGKVNPGESVRVFRESYDELKGHDNWSIVKKSKGKEKIGVEI